MSGSDATLETQSSVTVSESDANERRTYQTIDGLAHDILRDAVRAESHTWPMKPLITYFNNGKRCLSITNLTVTKIRAELSTGGYRCLWTIAGDVNSAGDTGNNPPSYAPLDFRVDALNAPISAPHGILFSFSWRQVIHCGDSRLYITNQFEPDVYDIWRDATVSTLAHKNWILCGNVDEPADSDQANHSEDPNRGTQRLNSEAFASDRNLQKSRAEVNPKPLATLTGHSTDVTAVAFSPTANRFVTADADGLIRVWGYRGGPRFSLITQFREGSSTWSIAFSPDGRLFATGGLFNGSIRLWDTTSWTQVQQIDGEYAGITALSFASDGKSFASGSAAGVVRIFDIQAGFSQRQLIEIDPSSKRSINWLSYSAADQLLAVRSGSKTLVFSQIDGSLVHQHQNTSGDSFGTGVFHPVHYSFYDIDDADYPNSIIKWNQVDWQSQKFRSSATGACSVAISPNGEFLITVNRYKLVTIFDLTKSIEIAKFVASSGLGESPVAVSSDSRMFATAGPGGNVLIWSTVPSVSL